jgi:RNA-binding motif protein, X-linked 2
MNVIKEIERINASEFTAGIIGGISKGSWHDKYKDSAWVYLGGMTFELSEGDILCVMSQWGEVEDINLVRDKATNKSLGYAFVKYEDQRSTILAVDNFNGIKLLGRTLRCDHVDKYKLSKDVKKREEDKLDNDPEAEPDVGPGHAYNDQEMANDFSISKGTDVWAPVKSQEPSSSSKGANYALLEDEENSGRKVKKDKKEKKEKKEKKHKESKDKKRKVERHDDRHESGSRDRERSRGGDMDNRSHDYSGGSRSKDNDRSSDIRGSHLSSREGVRPLDNAGSSFHPSSSMSTIRPSFASGKLYRNLLVKPIWMVGYSNNHLLVGLRDCTASDFISLLSSPICILLSFPRANCSCLSL